MAIKGLNKIDDNLTKIYENQVTTSTSSEWVDKTDILIAQMNFIALNNKSFLNLK
ncbi:MAG: hypothetical protein WCY19_02470 [Candidatus Gastranaerophilaceae bacterium]